MKGNSGGVVIVLLCLIVFCMGILAGYLGKTGYPNLPIGVAFMAGILSVIIGKLATRSEE